MKTIYSKLFMVVMMFALVLSFSPNSFAASLETISQQSIKNIKANLSDMGVDANTQNKLIEQLKSGQTWDSMNPAMKDSGKTTNSDHINSDGSLVHTVKTVFPDGSVSVVSITEWLGEASTNSDISLNAVSGGSSSCGSGYCIISGAKVDGGNGVITASFYADYTFVNGSYGSISQIYQPSVKAQVGSISGITGLVLRANETSSQSARAYYTWTFNNVPTGQATQYLNLDIQNNKATSLFTT